MRPASEVSANRASSSIFSGSSVGSATCTSVASTGSVGATAAASSTAAATPNPRNAQPRNAVATMVSGMAIPSIRQVEDQRRQPIGRFSANPAPISEMITHSSVRCRVKLWCSRGSGSGSGPTTAKVSAPAARNTIGNEIGAFRNSRGSSAASRVRTPTTA